MSMMRSDCPPETKTVSAPVASERDRRVVRDDLAGDVVQRRRARPALALRIRGEVAESLRAHDREVERHGRRADRNAALSGDRKVARDSVGESRRTVGRREAVLRSRVHEAARGERHERLGRRDAVHGLTGLGVHAAVARGGGRLEVRRRRPVADHVVLARVRGEQDSGRCRHQDQQLGHQDASKARFHSDLLSHSFRMGTLRPKSMRVVGTTPRNSNARAKPRIRAFAEVFEDSRRTRAENWSRPNARATNFVTPTPVLSSRAHEACRRRPGGVRHRTGRQRGVGGHGNPARGAARRRGDLRHRGRAGQRAHRRIGTDDPDAPRVRRGDRLVGRDRARARRRSSRRPHRPDRARRHRSAAQRLHDRAAGGARLGDPRQARRRARDGDRAFDGRRGRDGARRHPSRNGSSAWS